MNVKERENRRNAREEERAEIDAIKKSFKVDLGQVLSNLKDGTPPQGQASSGNRPEGVTGFYDPHVANKERMAMTSASAARACGPIPHHLNWSDVIGQLNIPTPSPEGGYMSSYASSADSPQEQQSQNGGPAMNQFLGSGPGSLPPQVNYRPTNTLSLSVNDKLADTYAPIMKTLGQFKFSQEENKRKNQMEIIAESIKDGLRKLAINEVYANTKRLYENVHKFTRTATGVKVIFNVGERKVAMTVDGEFHGDEIIALEQTGHEVTGYVTKEEAGQFPDYTSNYQVSIDLIES